MLLTFDDDFLRMVETEDVEHAGVVYVSQHAKDVGELIRRVDAALEQTDEIQGRIVYA